VADVACLAAEEGDDLVEERTVVGAGRCLKGDCWLVGVLLRTDGLLRQIYKGAA